MPRRVERDVFQVNEQLVLAKIMNERRVVGSSSAAALAGNSRSISSRNSGVSAISSSERHGRLGPWGPPRVDPACRIAASAAFPGFPFFTDDGH